MNDPINPNHYKSASGIECIEIAEVFPYNLGNAIKYAWRAGQKDDLIQDLKKCQWYLSRAYLQADSCELDYYCKNILSAKRKLHKYFENNFKECFSKQKEILHHIVSGDIANALKTLDEVLDEIDN